MRRSNVQARSKGYAPRGYVSDVVHEPVIASKIIEEVKPLPKWMLPARRTSTKPVVTSIRTIIHAGRVVNLVLRTDTKPRPLYNPKYLKSFPSLFHIDARGEVVDDTTSDVPPPQWRQMGKY